MIGNYKVVTICGSTRFKEEFERAVKRFTIDGYIVLSVGIYTHSGDEDLIKINDALKDMLCKMHRAKIDICDEIFVINCMGYIGESTQQEIEYATRLGKQIKYLERID